MKFLLLIFSLTVTYIILRLTILGMFYIIRQLSGKGKK
jgi:hypothetical protein